MSDEQMNEDRMLMTTLCYIEKDEAYLMLHRVKKKNDINHDKWIGVGGKFKPRESPEECLLREVKEETGLTLTSWQFRGIITFVQVDYPTEFMCLYTADGFSGEMVECDEGELLWVPKKDLGTLNLWEGDRIFLRKLEEEQDFFSMKLEYRGDDLACWTFNGKEMQVTASPKDHPREKIDILKEDEIMQRNSNEQGGRK